MSNPLLTEWDTPFSTPPFDSIKPEHYVPAVLKALEIARKEIDLIANNNQDPTFENTVSSLENSGQTLNRITSVFFNLNSAETNKQLQDIAQEISPLLARFSNDITLNPLLFNRISKIFENRENAGLTTEEKLLVEKNYRNFILGGAGLKEEERTRFREISEELSRLSLKFEENVLNETNAWVLHIKEESDLAGLPGGIVEAAHTEAAKRDKEGWIFTLHYPSYVPFMQYSEKRELREEMLRAYSSRAFRGNNSDNTENVTKIISLRSELSKMLGFRNYAEMTLGDRMADSPEKVGRFLEDLHRAANKAAHRDFNNLVTFADLPGNNDQIQRWDWPYYSEKLKKKLFDIDDEILKPFFPLEKVEEAIFGLANRLYGLSFIKNDTIPVYHPEVRTFEVYDSDKTFLAIFYADYHPREGKNGGAWMTSYRDQKVEHGKDRRPFISIVANFSRPTRTLPSLLTFNELTTFLHEFGHSLHGMLTRCTFESLSGTNVARDFVELPSQFMENYAYEKEWLDTWARHYLTGEKIPDEIIRKLKESSTFNEGYACFRQLGFGFLDMAWHTVTEPPDEDISSFEQKAMAADDLFPPVPGLNMSAQFTHIFGGGYAAGYYGYKWAEVLDADAFGLFEEKGIFDAETAESFRKNILEKGGTEKPQLLYRKFRGRDPNLDAFLKRSGLI